MKAVIIFLAALYYTPEIFETQFGWFSKSSQLTYIGHIHSRIQSCTTCLLVECRTKVKWQVWMSRTKWQF